MDTKLKKRAVSISLVVALAAALAAGGTMAYFTDKDTATNTFTMGNVDIKLIEKGLDDKGNIVDFEDANKVLTPGTSSENAVAKRVTVENTGVNDAYVWVEVLIPKELDDPDDASDNSLHFNSVAAYNKDYYRNWANYPSSQVLGITEEPGPDKLWDYSCGMKDGKIATDTDKKSGYVGEVIGENGIKYNKYVFLKLNTLKAKATSSEALYQVYMDNRVTQSGNGYLMTDGKTVYEGPWELVVTAYAIQADGFENVYDAYNAYYAQ